MTDNVFTLKQINMNSATISIPLSKLATNRMQTKDLKKIKHEVESIQF